MIVNGCKPTLSNHPQPFLRTPLFLMLRTSNWAVEKSFARLCCLFVRHLGCDMMVVEMRKQELLGGSRRSDQRYRAGGLWRAIMDDT